MLLKFLQCFDTVGLVAEGRLACKTNGTCPRLLTWEKNHRAVSCCSAYCIN